MLAQNWAHLASTIATMLGPALLIGGLGLVGCDSKTRGQHQTPATADTDRQRVETAGSGRKTSSTPPGVQPHSARAPDPDDLDRYLAALDGHGVLYAVIETTAGAIECRLYAQRAPMTVANFVGLASGKKPWVNPATGDVEHGKAFYDGVIFHRVIPHFLIQTGDPTGSGAGGPGYTIPDEFAPSLHHDRAGILSMANKGKPDSAGSQWFITLAPSPHLDRRNAVFGQCQDLDVVKRIARSPTSPDDRPKKPPRIKHIEFERRKTPPSSP